MDIKLLQTRDNLLPFDKKGKPPLQPLGRKAEFSMDFFYTIPRIPTCQAKVYFNADFNNLNYASEWYNNKSSYELANTVSIIQEATTSGIDADLADRSPISITTTELSNGTVGMPYGAPLEAEGGTWGYHWSLASGSLPDGPFLHGNGVIDGTPTAEGTFNFTFQVIDSSVPTPQTHTQSLSITIAPSPGMPDINVKQNTTDIPDGTESYDYGSHDINTNTDVIFTIENTGTGELTLYGIQITGTNADQFSITQQPSSPVAPGGNTILV